LITHRCHTATGGTNGPAGADSARGPRSACTRKRASRRLTARQGAARVAVFRRGPHLGPGRSAGGGDGERRGEERTVSTCQPTSASTRTGDSPAAPEPDLRELLAEFAPLRQQPRDPEARLAQHEAELAELRAAAEEAPPSPPTGECAETATPIADATLSLPGRASRRSMLARAAAAFGALGLAGAASGVPSVHARPPENV